MAERQARGIQRRAHAPVTPENGPPVGFPVQFRISGDKIATVRATAEKVAAQIRADARTVNVQFDWDEPSERSVRFEIDQQKAREVGVTSSDVSSFLALTLSGYTVTQYRERDKLINVELRAPRETRRPGPPGHAGHAHAWPRAAGQPGAAALRPGIRGDLGARPPAHHHGAGRRGRRRPGHRRDPRPRQAAGRAAPGAACRLSHQVGGTVEESAKGQNSINAQMPIMLVVVLTLLMVQLLRAS